MQPTREPWVRAYRTALIDEEDIVLHIDGIRLTPALTVIDLTRYLGDSALASAIEYVLGNGMCTVEMLYPRGRATQHPGPSMGPPIPSRARPTSAGTAARV